MSDSNGVVDDWTTAFEDSLADELSEVLSRLEVGRLQVYPPPKRGGLPFGHEIRILRRFLTRRSSVLDPSGLSRIYRVLASSRERLLYRALVMGEAMTEATWNDLLGRETVSRFRRHGLFEEHSSRRLRLRFRVLCLGELTLVVDHASRTSGHVHIGQDSLNLLEFLQRRLTASYGRMLDVGTGSGLLLIALGRTCEQAIGAEINPRAARLASLNVKLNHAKSCEVVDCDIFESNRLPGEFDLITWNTPFIFYPESQAADNVDGAGGHMGTAITLRFVERLPDLLAPTGVAHLLSASPILNRRESYLEQELEGRAQTLGLDITCRVVQAFWMPHLREFHRGFGIRHFESVLLEISHGPGRLRREGPGAMRRLVDFSRDAMYNRRS